MPSQVQQFFILVGLHHWLTKVINKFGHNSHIRGGGGLEITCYGFHAIKEIQTAAVFDLLA